MILLRFVRIWFATVANRLQTECKQSHRKNRETMEFPPIKTEEKQLFANTWALSA
jgi:hypothetical protein